MILYCATSNPGKLREFQQAAAHFGARGAHVDVLPGLKQIPAPAETGSTFRENAILKAVGYSAHTAEYVFADDSGLAVDALAGAPGVYSARFAGEGATDAANNALLLAKMRGRSDRAARFVCVVALARAGSLIGTFDGVVEGALIEEERGDGGFGYDPLFYFPPFGCTLAEVDEARKMDVSHRGKALAAMFRSLGLI